MHFKYLCILILAITRVVHLIVIYDDLDVHAGRRNQGGSSLVGVVKGHLCPLRHDSTLPGLDGSNNLTCIKKYNPNRRAVIVSCVRTGIESYLKDAKTQYGLFTIVHLHEFA